MKHDWPKKKDPKHLQAVRELGCIACRLEGRGKTLASAHHIREGQGMSQKASDYETIPLCPPHHQTGNGKNGVYSVHQCYRSFVFRFGSERSLLRRTVDDLRNSVGISPELQAAYDSYPWGD